MEPAAPTTTWQRIVRVVEPHQGGRFAALDGYRAIAAIGVLVYHVAGNAKLTQGSSPLNAFLANLGNFGVAVFFLLSGFLLYRGFVASALTDEPGPRWFRFWRHRFLRIYPAYWVALLAFIALIGLKMNPTLGNLASIFGLVQIYRPLFGFAALSVAWTLCIEVSFYVALPFIALGIQRGLGAAARTPKARMQAQLLGLGIMVAVAYIYRITIAAQATGPGDNQHLWLPNYLDWFALGMALALAVVWRDMGRPLPRAVQVFADSGWACWVVAAMAYGILMMLRSGGEATAGGFGKETATEMCLRFFFNGTAAFFFLLPGILSLRDPDRMKGWLSALVPAYLGTISYGIYLWHKIWLDWMKGTQPEPGFAASWGFWPTLAAVFALTVLSASASWFLIERPLLRFKDPRRRR